MRDDATFLAFGVERIDPGRADVHESDLAGMMFGEHQLAKVQAYSNRYHG
jgi:hypothetical protein